MLATKQPVLRRFWYPVMPMSHLTEGEPKPFTLLGESIALWRTSAGALACVKDRCCHRSAKLSLGYIENDNIVCGYHGWAFASDGRCVLIPQKPEQAPREGDRVDGYRVVERYGYVWVALAEPLTDIPDFPEADAAGFRHVHEFYETWNIGALRLMENSFDAAHIAFVHRATFGNARRPEIQSRELTLNDWGFVTTSSVPVEVRGDVARKAVRTDGAQTRRDTTSVWHMPFVRRTAIQYPHGLIHTLITCATPVTDDVSMIVQWVYRNDTEEQVSTADVVAFDRAVTLEDKAILESCDPDVPLLPTEERHMMSDNPGMVMRNMLSNLLKAHGETEHRRSI
jgi:phenylpropionate dioxygenase-like ring-hydroxylating dioxygenase large terminal subunit